VESATQVRQPGYLDVFSLSGSGGPLFTTQLGVSGAKALHWSPDGTHVFAADSSQLETISTSTHAIVDKKGIVQSSELRAEGSFLTAPSLPAESFADVGLNNHIAFAGTGKNSAFPPELVASSAPNAVAISPDGKILISSGPNGLDVWQMPSGKLLAASVPVANGGSVEFVNNEQLVVIQDQQSVAVVDLSSHKLIARACAIAGRNLSRQEFADYLPSQPYHVTCPQWARGA
jgi:WD40 repeat protein